MINLKNVNAAKILDSIFEKQWRKLFKNAISD